MEKTLISTDYSLEAFCRQMLEENPAAIMEAASAESARARRIHRKTTREAIFRKGSRGQIYCADLQCLISMLMGGSVPPDATPEFLATVTPLVLRLLRKWDIGNLRHVFDNVPISVRSE